MRKRNNEVTDVIFARKKPNPRKLLSFGFTEDAEQYHYEASMAENQFQLEVSIAKDGHISTRLTDTASGEEYVLHLIAGACGTFVGMVKAEYESILQEIADRCFDPDVFQEECTKHVILHVRNTYQDEPEFLWKHFPDNAVFRRKDTGKWYGAILRLPGNKLGFPSSEMIEILDLRIKPEELEGLIDCKTYFPGYHMNKKHWYTICLDGSVPNEEIYARIKESYRLAVK